MADPRENMVPLETVQVLEGAAIQLGTAIQRVWAEAALRESEESYRELADSITDVFFAMDQDLRYTYWNKASESLTGIRAEDALGKSLLEVFPDTPWVRRAEKTYRDLLRTQQPQSFVNDTDLGGRHYVFEISAYPSKSGISVFVKDITGRKRAEEVLQRALEETARGQRLLLALSHAAQAVQRAHSPEEVYQTVGQEIVALGYQAALFLLTDDRLHLAVPYYTFDSAVVRAAEKLTGLSAPGYCFPLVPGGFFQQIITQRKTTFIDATTGSMAEALPGPVGPLAAQVAALLGQQQSIVAPLMVAGEVYGMLVVSGVGLSEADVPAVTVFANQTAIAIENAQLLEQVCAGRERLQALSRRLVELQETSRRELARELHDRVGQSLTGLNLNLILLRSVLPPESAQRIGTRLDDSLRLVAETVDHIRDVMAELRPAVLDDYGLAAALRWYGEQFAQRTGLLTQVQGEAACPRLPARVETALFRIAQEALTNVARHAQARAVLLTLATTAEGLRLTIADDGMGFDPAAFRQRGTSPAWGLATMRERAEAVGGRFAVDSALGKGTRIVVEVAVGNG
jgi:PAS domain S-box-containing protein